MRKFFSILVIAVMALSLAACGSKPGFSSPKYSGNVMLYSSMQEDQIVAIKKGFEAKYPDIKMDYYFAGTGKVITKIAAEKQAGRVAADIIWVGDPTDYMIFKEQGILAPYISPESEAIDAAFIDPEHYYTGARMMNVGFAYNTTIVKPEDAPRTWNELLDSKWANQIVTTDPGSSGTMKFFVSVLMLNDKYGVTFFEKLKANGCELESGSTATHNRVAVGAYKVGICLDYITANMAAEGSPIGFIYPDNDIVSITSPIGLVANCANEENAKLLYDFILSKEGQEILVANNLMSVRNDVKQEGVDVDFIASKSLKVDIAYLAKKSDEVLDSFDKIFKYTVH